MALDAGDIEIGVGDGPARNDTIKLAEKDNLI
jgi:hypothetical protein